MINQVFGLGLFYVLSRALDKDGFGELNWTLAVFMTAFGVLGMGLDQLTVRKIAAGDPPGKVIASYRFHVWTTGLLFYALLLGGSFLAPAFFLRHPLLLWIGIAKAGLFFSTPYKQLATGKEAFRTLRWMSVVSSVIKGCVVLVCFFLHRLTMPVLLVIFITGDLVELGVCAYLGKGLLKERLALRVDPKVWMGLLKESLPQTGVVLFSAAMARFDWIFIGLFCPAARLAEYSFAYKAFEVSSLPLLIIAPLLVPAFTRFTRGDLESRMPDLQRLLRGEMILACGTAMLLNMVWSPWVDALTAGRYGAVNARTIGLLSACLPLSYLNNFLWSLHFAKGRLKMIFWVFALSFAVNAVGDVCLIPIYGNEGAALAYLLSLGIQMVCYLSRTTEPGLRWSWVTLVMASASAAFCGYLSVRLWTDTVVRAVGAGILYLFVLMVTLQIRKEDLNIKQPFGQRPRME